MFLLAPLLLLLSPDPLLLPRMGDAQRYFPPLLAASGYLLATSCYALVLAAADGEAASVARQLGALVLAVPPHVLCLQYLWSQKARAPGTIAAMLPLAIISGVLGAGQVEPISYLTWTGVVLAVVLYFSMRHTRYVGMKAI